MGSKLSLGCTCGETMVVPVSVLGKTGLCPFCGTEILITTRNTHAYMGRTQPKTTVQSSEGSGLLEQWSNRKRDDGHEVAWRKFAEAVDLYNAGRFAEALTLLGALKEQFPENPHVLQAEVECGRALAQSRKRILENGANELTPELVHRVILDKMLHGSSESVQLEAAMLAAKLMGMLPEDGTMPEQLSGYLTKQVTHAQGRAMKEEIS